MGTISVSGGAAAGNNPLASALGRGAHLAVRGHKGARSIDDDVCVVPVYTSVEMCGQRNACEIEASLEQAMPWFMVYASTLCTQSLQDRASCSDNSHRCLRSGPVSLKPPSPGVHPGSGVML